MARNQYKGITFEDKYSKTFDQFQKEFQDVWVFRVLPEKEKLAELKIAFKIATKEEEEKK